MANGKLEGKTWELLGTQLAIYRCNAQLLAPNRHAAEDGYRFAVALISGSIITYCSWRIVWRVEE